MTYRVSGYKYARMKKLSSEFKILQEKIKNSKGDDKIKLEKERDGLKKKYVQELLIGWGKK